MINSFVRCGAVDSVEGMRPGIWIYTYCIRCGFSMMIDFATNEWVKGWQRLTLEISLKEIRK